MPFWTSSTTSWSSLPHSATACCFPAADNPRPLSPPPAAFNDIPHGEAASTTSNTTAASDLQSGLSIRSLSSLRSLQISTIGLPGLPSTSSPPSSVAAASAGHRLLSSLTSHPCRSASTSLAVYPAGRLLYSASHSGVAVYDLVSFRLVEAFRSVASGAVKALAFSPDGRVFTAHQDSKIRVWMAPPPAAYVAITTVWEPSSAGQHTARRPRPLVSLPTLADRLRRFAVPGNYVAVRRHRKRLWIEHADAVSGLAVGCGLLYSVSWDKTLKIWRASDLRCLQSISAHDDAVNAIAVAPDGTVYTGSADRRIRVWQPPPTEPDSPRRSRYRYSLAATLEWHRSAVNALALSADGGVLCSGACDRFILVWERTEAAAGYMAVVGAIRGHQKGILCLAIAGDLLVSGSTDQTVRVWWRTAGGEYCCLAVMEGHVGGVRSVAAHRVGSSVPAAEEEYRICSGSSDGEVRVWEVRVSFSSSDDCGDNKGELALASNGSG